MTSSFASACILAGSILALTAGRAAAGQVYCSDLTALSSTSGWSTVQKDRCINTNPINLGGKVYAKGLGTHAPSEIVYALGGKYVSFSATVGIDDGTKGKGSSEFLVYADDSLVFKSGVIRGRMAPAVIAVSVAGKNRLRLVTTIGPDNYDMDDADWADALLVEKPPVSALPARSGAAPGKPGSAVKGIVPAGSVLVYDLLGKPVWSGLARPGHIPETQLPAGRYLLSQDSQTLFFRVPAR